MSVESPRVVIAGTALVTGGTSGIGLEFARQLAERGCDLVLAARTLARLEETAAELRAAHGVEVEILQADLGTPEGIETVVARLTAETPSPIDILVNNAGSGLHADFAIEDLSPHLQGLDLMVKAPLVLGATAARVMKARDRGIIINVGSVAGLIAMNGYSAIKSWMNTFSDALALELVNTHVHVVTLLPGWVRTEFHQRANVKASAIPNFLWLDPDRLVKDTLVAVERGQHRAVPSKRFKVLGALAHYAPRPLVAWATSMIKKGRDK